MNSYELIENKTQWRCVLSFTNLLIVTGQLLILENHYKQNTMGIVFRYELIINLYLQIYNWL